MSLVACWFSQVRHLPRYAIGVASTSLPSSSSCSSSSSASASSSSLGSSVPTGGVVVDFEGIASSSSEGAGFQSSLRRKELISALHRLPIYCGMTLKTHDQCKRIAQRLVGDRNIQRMFVLGKGFAEPIAREGALKIKVTVTLRCSIV